MGNQSALGWRLIFLPNRILDLSADARSAEWPQSIGDRRQGGGGGVIDTNIQQQNPRQQKSKHVKSLPNSPPPQTGRLAATGTAPAISRSPSMRRGGGDDPKPLEGGEEPRAAAR